MTNADVVKELMLLKDSGHPVSAMVILYAGMVNVRHFDRPGFSARDAALTLLSMVRSGPSAGASAGAGLEPGMDSGHQPSLEPGTR